MGASGFDVVVLSVRHPPESAAHALARVFGLRLGDAERLCRGLPCAAVHDLPYHHAERLAAQARSAGLDVQVVAHRAELERVTLPEVPARLTLPELGSAQPARAVQGPALPAPITLRPGAPVARAAQPTAINAPSPSAVLVGGTRERRDGVSVPAPAAQASANAPSEPPPAQAAVPAGHSAERFERWFEAADDPPTLAPSRAHPASVASAEPLAFAAGFGRDADLEHARPARTPGLLTLLPSVDLMRDSSLPFLDAEAPACEAGERKSLGFLLSFPASPRSDAAASPEVTPLTQRAAGTPAWPGVDLENAAAADRSRAANTSSSRAAYQASADRTRPEVRMAPSLAAGAKSPQSKRTLRPANLSFGVNDGGGTGLPRRTVWLLAVLWLSVALLLWSRGLLF